MRKSALFLVVLAIVLSLNGCSQTSANRYSPSYSPDSAPNNKTYNFILRGSEVFLWEIFPGEVGGR